MTEFHPIPGHPGNYVSKEGKLWCEFKGIYPNVYKSKTDGVWKSYIWDSKTGVRSSIYIIKALALAFIPLPPNKGDRVRILRPYQVDGDKDNLSLDNIRWGDSSEVYFSFRNKEIRDAVEKYSIPDLRDGSGMYPNGIESKTKPGFYHIPFTLSPLVVNDNGVIFNLVTNKKVTPYLCPKGYSITSTPWMRDIATRVHRAVAMVFCPIPERIREIPVSELHVNHINLDKANNAKDNLEWMTSSENSLHAWENGAFTHEKPVLRRNVLTGEVERFQSILALSKELGVLNGTLIRILDNKDTLRLVRDGNFQYKYDDGTDWQLPVDCDSFITTKKCALFLTMNLVTGRKQAFHTATEAAAYYGKKIGGYRDAIRRKGSYTPYHGFRRITLEEFLRD